MMLTCAGVNLAKRLCCGEVDGSDQEANLRRSMGLVFVLLVLMARPADPLSEGEEREEREEDDEKEEKEVATGQDADAMDVEKEKEEEEEDPLHAMETRWKKCLSVPIRDSMIDSSASSSSDAPRARPVTSAEVSKLCLEMASAKAPSMTLQSLEDLAATFFHETGLVMASQLLLVTAPEPSKTTTTTTTTPSDDFLTLSSATFLKSIDSERNVKLDALAEVAESEAGQATLRDLILSFTLPSNVVGVRRTCLLTRKANNVATKEYPLILNSAHDAAMRGASWSWTDDEEVLHKMCAILAGVAVLLFETQQSLRKDDAFRGRISLPFLETRLQAEDESRPRMHFNKDRNVWSVFEMRRGRGEEGLVPCVLYSGSGFEGFCDAVLLFVKSVDS